MFVLLITAQPIRNLWDASVRKNEQKGYVLIAGVPYPLSPISQSLSLSPFLPILPLSTLATQAMAQ